MARRMVGSRYRLERQLAEGSRSEVYLGHDLVLLRPVAITFMIHSRSTPPSAVNRFIGIGQALAGIDSRHLATIYEIGDDPSDPYIVTEYLSGQSLREIIDNEGPFDPDDVAILIEQLATGLHHAAGQGVHHGLLSPDHVIVNSSGLAKLVGFTALEESPGEPARDGVEDHRSAIYQIPDPPQPVTALAQDCYALAAIAYEMLSGQPPVAASQIAGDPDATFIAHPSQVNPEIPVQAGDIVMRTLERAASGAAVSPNAFAQELTNWRFAAKPGTDPQPRRVRSANAAEKATRTTPTLPGSERPPALQMPPVAETWRELARPERKAPIRRRTPVKWLGIGALGAALAALVIFWSSLEPALTGSTDHSQNPSTTTEPATTPTPNSMASQLTAEPTPTGSTVQANARAVVGLPFDEAEQELASNGLIAIRRYVPNPSAPVGIVVGFEEIDPEADPRAITLLTSRGTLVEVPPALFGMPLTDGERLLGDLGLDVRATIGVSRSVIESFSVDLTEAGIVDGDIVGIQEPEHVFGSLVEPGAALTLVYYDASEDDDGAGD